jgi:hypothetical protein
LAGNNAIPNLVFSDTDRFHSNFPNFELIENTPTECIKVLVSGGVIAKSKTIQLPMMLLHLVNAVDSFLVFFYRQYLLLGDKFASGKR